MQPAPEVPGPAAAAPRSDFIAALVWIVFGVAVSVGAWNMDRLENQDVPPYAVPGLLPFFLGLAIVFFALLMLARAWRQGALAGDAANPGGSPARMSPAERRRFAVVLALCLIFAVGLVGHGLPFWLASAIFVAVTIFVLQYSQRHAENQLLRGAVLAVVIGLGAGLGVTLVFQEIFLVHLP